MSTINSVYDPVKSLGGEILGLYLFLGWFIPLFIPYHWITVLILHRKIRLNNHLVGPNLVSILILKFFYGLVNPFCYLLIYQNHPNYHSPPITILNFIAISFLCIYWSLTLFSPVVKIDLTRYAFFMRIRQLTAKMGLALLGIFFLKDIIGILKFVFGDANPNFIFGQILMLFTIQIPLYLVPGYLLYFDSVHQFTNQREKFSKPMKFVFSPIAAFVVGCFICTLIPVPDSYLRKRISQLDQSFSEIAAKYKIDKMLLESIVLVGNKEHSNILRFFTKDAFSQIWAWDNVDHLELTRPFNISIGLCQVKPATAFEYLWIYQVNKTKISYKNLEWPDHYRYFPDRLLYKEARSNLTRPDHVIDNIALTFETPFPGNNTITRAQIFKTLQTPEGNIRLAAFILRMIQEHWKAKGFDIAGRPDIIATIYNIGFKNSHPKANPQPNEFGKAVAEEMKHLSDSGL